jgi:hypothetical protein
MKDFDGLWCVDVLGYKSGPPHEKRHIDKEVQLLEKAKARAQRDVNDLRLLAKHNWMIQYLERVIAEAQ